MFIEKRLASLIYKDVYCKTHDCELFNIFSPNSVDMQITIVAHINKFTDFSTFVTFTTAYSVD